MEDIRVSGQEVGFGGESLWRIAFLTALGSLGVVPQAEATIYYWQDSGPGFTQSIPPILPRQPKARRPHDTKAVVTEKESAKPQGPLIISISITEQKLRLYDANGLFAESPVSTGMPGHPTPMGAFSIIQKQKFHRSNIYSGAPMPFMQRITWSGVALHAGVVPGHPASHGCIRMPAAFAVKMWNWTRVGARVVITPGSISPDAFSHPVLAALKVLPETVTSKEPKNTAAAQGSENAPKNQANVPPALPEPKAELRLTIGHADNAKPLAEALDTPTAPQTQTADASGTLSEPASMSDAAPAGQAMPAATDAVSDKRDASTALPDARLASDTSVISGPNRAPDGEIRPQEKPANSVPPAVAKPTPTGNQSAEDVQPKPRPDPTSLIKRSGQIAIFVSRKDSKLYVRQNFSPLFDLPVTIAADERPLGTHIFTAQVDHGDANVLHWSVVSLPAPVRHAEWRAQDRRSAPGRKAASPPVVAAKAQPLPDGPAEALDRLHLPREAMARIFEAISTGGSIIVSDQGIDAGETGEGTDFIVSLR